MSTPTPPEPSRPLGVAILAVLIGIFGILWIVLGALLLGSFSIGTAGGALPPGFGEVGLVAGAVILVIGLIILGLALGLWHQRMWALVLTILVLLFVVGNDIYHASYTLGLFVAVLLLVYLIAVHRHFD